MGFSYTSRKGISDCDPERLGDVACLASEANVSGDGIRENGREELGVLDWIVEWNDSF